jgi:TPR repeat protein
MQRQIEELRRKAEQGSQQLQGEAQELELESLLRIKFARDTIDPVPKGEFGGDVLHRVIGPLGQLCGTILWESKRTKNWSDGWLPKLRDDQRAAKAEIALLVTQVLPKGVEAFDFIDGVWVTESRCAIPVAIALRQSLVELATARQAGEGQKTKMELVYQYLTGPRFIPIWIALALMAGAMGTSAQSANSKPSQSIAALKVKAENGDAAAQWSLAFLYEAGRGVPQDYQQAEKWYHKLAEGGNSFAQNHIGFMYNQGLGVPQDYAQSAVWYRKAAEQGDTSAQYNLGLLYQSGQGVPQDYAQTVLWFRKAAGQGDADAQYALAYAYAKGEGVPQDYKEAARLAEKSAEQGIVQAQHSIGSAYHVGQGVPQDYAMAAYWYRKAAEQGDANSQYSLGLMYEGGLGVPQDYAEAYFWLDLATSGKLDGIKPDDVVSVRDGAASYLTSTVLLQTQARARKWFEDHPAKPQ